MSYVRLGVDVGGTFTDFAFLRASGEIVNVKVPSTPADPSQAIEDGLTLLARTEAVDEIRHFAQGTTLGVNTLLQRNGSSIGLLVTKGFKDMLEIGRLRLPDPTNYLLRKPEALVPRFLVREIPERLNASGAVIRELDEKSLKVAVDELVAEGVAGIAICFMHAYRNGEHEKRCADYIRSARPDLFVCTSSEIWPEQREYERSLVTVINAYIGPLVSRYFSKLSSIARGKNIGSKVLSTKSNGGVMSSESACEVPVATLLSGPASGVIGARHIGQLAGIDKLIGFDMGGTSSEVAIIDGEVAYSTDSIIGDFPLVMPAVDVSSIGAGGGSIAWTDNFGVLRVGPQSAGAMPGPACYDRGGKNATVTDAFVECGIIDPRSFAGGLSLKPELARAALKAVGDPLGLTTREVASAILKVATANMYSQLILLLARRGVDQRDFALLPYGGAGPTHALLLAREAGIDRVVVPPSPGTLCAFGSLVADIKNDLIETVYEDIANLTDEQLHAVYERLEREGKAWIESQGAPIESVQILRSADVRYKGQSFDLGVRLSNETTSLSEVKSAFYEIYESTYGYKDLAASVEIINIRLTVVGRIAKPEFAEPPSNGAPAVKVRDASIFLDDREMIAPVFRREEIQIDQSIPGPCLIEAPDTTILVVPDYTATMKPYGILMIEKA